MRAYPDEPVSRNYKIKETHVVSRVKERFTQVTWICDKRYDFAPTECGSKRRPDMYCHMGHFVLVVEIDENQQRMLQGGDPRSRTGLAEGYTCILRSIWRLQGLLMGSQKL